VGQGALAGASVLGLGALAFYGLGMSKEVGAVERAIVWPEHVRQRIRSTYSMSESSTDIYIRNRRRMQLCMPAGPKAAIKLFLPW
jgi:hypothetical protein